MSLLSLLLAAWTGWAGAADLRAPQPVVLPLAVPGAAAAAPVLPALPASLAAGYFRSGAESPAATALPALPDGLSTDCTRVRSVDGSAVASAPSPLSAAQPGNQISAIGRNLSASNGLRALDAALAKPGAERALSAAFDGSARSVPGHTPWTTAAPAGRRVTINLGAVSTDNPVHALRLREIIAAAESTPTGRKILGRAQALARKKGPVPVSFGALGTDLGAYEYTEGRMVLSRALLSEPPAVAAATLVHELIHVLQHDEGLPAEALELELEAHMMTLEYLDEAGLRPDSSFSQAARERLAEGPDALHDWMAGQLASKFSLRGSSPEELADQLEEELDALQQRRERLADTPKNRHRRDKLERLAQWTAHDLALLRSPDGLKRYRALARRVKARAKRLSAKYAAAP